VMRGIVDVGATPTTVPPSATTSAATSITTSSAALNGNLTGLGSADSVQVSFEYGTTASYGNTTAVQTRSDTGAFSASLSGLSLGTTYHYRVKAAGDGTVYGSDMTFTTSGNQPPVLNPISNKKINEGAMLKFTISASDPDSNVLTYTASNLPAGAAFDSATRTFSWRPTYWQSGNYYVNFRVSDGVLTDSKTITITVRNIRW
ncbi:MAG: putative Ig domain-containing protein, partial [Dehalococcoidales bacterium]|nr:putative Ig domain-containing protein [Dehalococcoidales bacterium]